MVFLQESLKVNQNQIARYAHLLNQKDKHYSKQLYVESELINMGTMVDSHSS